MLFCTLKKKYVVLYTEDTEECFALKHPSPSLMVVHIWAGRQL